MDEAPSSSPPAFFSPSDSDSDFASSFSTSFSVFWSFPSSSLSSFSSSSLSSSSSSSSSSSFSFSSSSSSSSSSSLFPPEGFSVPPSSLIFCPFFFFFSFFFCWFPFLVLACFFVFFVFFHLASGAFLALAFGGTILSWDFFDTTGTFFPMIFLPDITFLLFFPPPISPPSPSPSPPPSPPPPPAPAEVFFVFLVSLFCPWHPFSSSSKSITTATAVRYKRTRTLTPIVPSPSQQKWHSFRKSHSSNSHNLLFFGVTDYTYCNGMSPCTCCTPPA